MKNKKMRNNQGFSLVELLAVIVILGLLGVIAIVGISSVLNKAEKDYYETQQNDMVLATQSYTQDNRNVLPKEIGDTRIVTLSELKNAKYIGNIVDRSNNECAEGSVTIFKYSSTSYSYKPYLVCGSKEYGTKPGDEPGPKINLTTDTTYANPSFSYEITPNNSEDDGKIISYGYKIYNYGVLVRDSGSIPVSNVSTIEKTTVSLKDLIPGKFTIVFSATNHYGGTSIETISDIEIINKDGPECGEVTPKINEWANVDEVTINITCIDTTGSGCAREIFQQHFTAESEKNYIEITNNAGIVTRCPVDTYIDRTPPTKPVISNPYENTWINKSYSIQVSSTDDTSGIAYFQYRYPDSAISEEREWKSYEESSGEAGVQVTFTTTEFSNERNEYVEIRACDYAGNCSEPTQSMIKIDKTSPTCSITKTGTGGPTIYTSNVSLALNISDPGESSKATYTYGMASSSTATYNSVSSKTQGATSGITWYGFVKDEAGNSSTCNTGKFQVLLKPPVITFSISGSTSTATCKDGNTGAAISISSGATKTITVSNLTHSVTCTNAQGQSTTSSITYKATCSSSKQVCDTCHGSYQCNCKQVCDAYYVGNTGDCMSYSTQCSTCTSSYDCDCYDECQSYSFSK